MHPNIINFYGLRQCCSPHSSSHFAAIISPSIPYHHIYVSFILIHHNIRILRSIYMSSIRLTHSLILRIVTDTFNRDLTSVETFPSNNPDALFLFRSCKFRLWPCSSATFSRNHSFLWNSTSYGNLVRLSGFYVSARFMPPIISLSCEMISITVVAQHASATLLSSWHPRTLRRIISKYLSESFALLLTDVPGWDTKLRLGWPV